MANEIPLNIRMSEQQCAFSTIPRGVNIMIVVII